MEENSYENIVSRKSNGYTIFAAIVFAVIVCVIFCAESYLSYQNTVGRTNTSLLSISQLIEEKIVKDIESIDLILKANQKDLIDEEISAQNSNRLSQKLKQEIERTNHIYSFKIISTDGDLVGDNITPVKKVNYNDREYFKVIKSSGKDILYINPPVVSLTTNNWVIVLCRPILDSNKKFKGALVATISVTNFMKNFSNYELSKNGLISLYNRNNVMFLRYPWIESIAGKKVNRPKLIQDFINSQREISYDEMISPVDDIARLAVNKKIFNDQFIITVGESKQVVLAHWYKKFIFFSILLLGSGILFYFFFIKFLNSIEELERKRRETIQSAKLASIGEMTAGIAHEINNPIMIIFGAIRSIKKHMQTDPEKVANNFKKIETQIIRIDRIIKGLKTFTRDSRYEDFSFVDAMSIVQNSIDLLKSELSSIEVEVEIIDELKNKILECNEIQIEQVIVNLIKNSIDAIKGMSHRWIKIHLSNKNKMIIIKIIDSGDGIPSSIRSKIMNPFFTTKEVGKGTGLGLSISQGIIASHGGNFYLDSSEKNTCFVIELSEGINFDYVIKTHLEFKDNLKKYILNPNKSIDKNIIGSDKNCEFGAWIKKYNDKYSHIEEWNLTKAKHKDFHEIAGKIIELSEEKNQEQVDYNLLQLDKTSDEIMMLLFKLKELIK